MSHEDDYDRRNACRCGSGLHRYELVDAAGIFCAFVCEKCEPAKRRTFNPAIFDTGSYYAGTGDEQDIGFNPHDC